MGESSLHLKVIQYTLRRQTTRDHCSGQPSAGMRTRAGEIQILITGMLIMRAEISQLGQVMAKSVCRAFHQVITLVPGEWCEIHLELNMGFKVGDAKTRQTVEDMLTRIVSNLDPILLAV